MVDVRVLGPLEVWRGHDAVAVGGPKPRTVLALLVAGGGRAVPVDVLVDEVWGDAVDSDPRRTLQVHVSNLRTALGADAITYDGDAYRLVVARECVDVWSFEDTLDGCRRPGAEPALVAARLREALASWRGRPYAGTQPSETLEAEARRLEALRLGAIEDRIEADLELGRHEEVVAELEGLVRSHPLRERLRGQHLLALYRCGRQAEAVAAFEHTRQELAEALGVDPSPALKQLHRRILSQDPSLLPEAPVGPAGGVAPPSGMVTFVFTDIEGSTRLLHRLGDGYADVLERHRQLLREAWAAEDGYEVSVDGDGMFAAFADADAAVRACIRAQRALRAEPWPEGGEVAVRIGVHSGLASPVRGDYVALAVHEAARVMAAAPGGHILLTGSTLDLLRDADALGVHPLGRFRLRGFDEPIRLYVAQAEGLPQEPPSVRAVPADSHNLVAYPTETVGREELVAAVAADVTAGVLCTLVGPGGVGKTRIVTEVGMRIAPHWEDGVWLVELAPIADPELVPVAVAEAIGVPTGGGRDRWEDVLEHLAERRAVIVLDNCEHVVAACRTAIDALLAGCSGVGILATSREPLHRPGELVRRVEPLALSAGDAPHDVTVAPATRLFEARGGAARAGFRVDDHNAPVVAEICRQLGGVPLLIELAAALLAVQSPVEILAALEDRPGALRHPDPLVDERHRSVDELIGWSYRRLDDEERAVFRRLSVFGTGFSLGTASAAVAAGGPVSGDVVHLIWSLVDRSLVTADLTSNATRYRVLEPVRRYGRGLLREAGEVEDVATGLARALLETVGPWLPTDRNWVGEVGLELDNVRALIPLLPGAEEESAQQLACSIGTYHDSRQSFRDGIRELSGYVDRLRRPTATRVSLLTRLADLHLRTGETAAAERLADLAAGLRDEHGAPDWDDVAVDRTRGEIARRSGDLRGAVAIARAALQRQPSARGQARMHNLLGTTSAALGDLDTAYESCAAELRLNREVGYEPGVASAHGNLAEVSLRLGDLPAAAHHQRACLELALTQGSPAMVAFSMIVAARVAGSRDEWDTAVRLHARAESMLEDTGLALYEDDRRESDELLAKGRGALGDAPFAAALGEGTGLPVSEAVGMADAVLAESERERIAVG